MEAIVLGVLLLVVGIKGGTAHQLSKKEATIRDVQSEEADISKRLQSTETALRQLEQDKKNLDQEFKHLENDKDLLCMNITELGGTPVPESKLDEDPKAQTATAQTAPPESSSETEDQPGTGGKTAASVQTPDGKSRILVVVVDDNEELRELLQKALTNEYEVQVAGDGLEALSQILKEKQHYDLVITDLNMPKVNGITLAENLPPNIPTIIISAFLKKPAFQQALDKIQPAGVFEKPFPMSSLRAAIRQALAP